MNNYYIVVLRPLGKVTKVSFEKWDKALSAFDRKDLIWGHYHGLKVDIYICGNFHDVFFVVYRKRNLHLAEEAFRCLLN